MFNQDFWNSLNLLNIYSVYLALENLYENRQQSEQNDVHSANQEQAEYMLNRLTEKFEEQNAMLREILDLLRESH